MNPLSFTGPQFLAFWFVGWIAVILVMIAVRATSARSRQRREAADLAASLHPTEIGYLVGGLGRAIEAAIAGLHHRGLVEIDRGLLQATDRPGKAVRPDGVFRGVVTDDLTRVEAFVLDQLPSSIHALTAEATTVETSLRRRLEEAGLLVEDRARTTLMIRLAGLAWLGLGFVKLGVGIARDRPIGLLLLITAVGVVVTFAFRARRLTWLGSAVAALVSRRHHGLELTARTAPEQLSGGEMTLAYAVFGPVVAAAALLPVVPSYQASQAAAASGVGSCGGASCGGGCGGGCGGCGGCG